MKTLLKRYKTYIFYSLVVLLYVAASYIFDLPCPIKYFTGISCMGCGMTRACISVLRLDLAGAFYYHPLWIMLPFAVILLFVFRNKRKAYNAISAVCIALFFAVYVYRIAIGSPVLGLDIRDGVIYRYILALFSIFK